MSKKIKEQIEKETPKKKEISGRAYGEPSVEFD